MNQVVQHASAGVVQDEPKTEEAFLGGGARAVVPLSSFARACACVCFRAESAIFSDMKGMLKTPSIMIHYKQLVFHRTPK